MVHSRHTFRAICEPDAMRTVRHIIPLTVLLLALLAFGCGSSAAPGTATADSSGGVSPDTPTTSTPGGGTTTTEPTSTDDGPAAPPPILSSADRRSFQRLAASLSGSEGIAVSAVGTGQEVWTAGAQRSGVAWSTAKVPVAMAAIGAGRANQGDLVAAITASNNEAAERLWSSLGAGQRASTAATRQLRRAGDRRTVVQAQRIRPGYTPFGQTRWALADQVRFVAGMRCTAPGRRVLGLMGQVVGGQRWGLGSTGGAAQFKGGWGPGISPGAADGWLDRQMGVIEVGGRKLAVAILTTAGDHGTGTSNLTRMAQWVKRNANPEGIPTGNGCG
jgi:hypothetical protein